MAYLFGVDPDVIYTWDYGRWLRFKKFTDDHQKQAKEAGRGVR